MGKTRTGDGTAVVERDHDIDDENADTDDAEEHGYEDDEDETDDEEDDERDAAVKQAWGET